MKKLSVIFIVLIVTGCSTHSSKFKCGYSEGLGCTSASDVYKIKVLGEKTEHQSVQKRKDGSYVLNQVDSLDYAEHQFAGSLQSNDDNKDLKMIPLTRQPIYRTVYIPGETVISPSGRPMRVMPRMVVIEQVPGGFIDNNYDGERVSPLQIDIPIQSEFTKKTRVKK